MERTFNIRKQQTRPRWVRSWEPMEIATIPTPQRRLKWYLALRQNPIFTKDQTMKKYQHHIDALPTPHRNSEDLNGMSVSKMSLPHVAIWLWYFLTILTWSYCSSWHEHIFHAFAHISFVRHPVFSFYWLDWTRSLHQVVLFLKFRRKKIGLCFWLNEEWLIYSLSPSHLSPLKSSEPFC